VTRVSNAPRRIGLYKGCPEDTARDNGIARMIAAGQSWTSIQVATGCSRATVAKIAKRAKQAA
jgi:DNA invertase Pin-like site-specific DNA recombinase